MCRLMEHGMLSPEKAKKAFEKKQKKKQKELRAGNPIAETSNKQESKNGDIKAKKIVVENDGDDDDDDDVILSSKRRKR